MELVAAAGQFIVRLTGCLVLGVGVLLVQPVEWLVQSVVCPPWLLFFELKFYP